MIPRLRVFLRLSIVAALAIALGSCSRNEPARAATTPVAKHEHHPPHGGTAIVLGNETYHLELVLDAGTGRLTAYVLDGEMENFVRVKAPAIEIVATVGAESHPLTLRAMANAATGETVGDTSQFEANAGWLKTAATFDGRLVALEIRGTKFENVAFNFPKGNDRD
jgi:hypothetical protein